MLNINNYDVEGIAEDSIYELWRFIAEEVGGLADSGDFPIELDSVMTHNQVSIIEKVVFNEDCDYVDRDIKDNDSYLTKDIVKELEEEENLNLKDIVEKGTNIFWNEVSKLIKEFNLEDITKDGKEEIELQKKEFLNYLKIWLYYNLNEDYQEKIEEEEEKRLKL